jgi:sirohydrochlorin ferrochelatase
MVKTGVSKIVLVPAFLAPGVHTTQEIPELIEVKEKQPNLKELGIELVYGEPIGSDERIADILEEKAFKALGQDIKKDSEVVDAYSVTEAGKIVDKSMMLIREAMGADLDNVPKDQVPIIERVVHTQLIPNSLNYWYSATTP